jgi:hypothetical protein
MRGSSIIQLVAWSGFKSPRARRRFVWLSAILVAAAITGIVFALLPNSKGGFKGAPSGGPVQIIRTQRQVPVSTSTRAEVNALFDRFVPAAVGRHDPAAAYDLVTPALKTGSTREQWRTGDIPVSPFDAGGTTFHGWSVVTSYPTQLTLDLTLQPRNPKEGPASFTVYLERVKGRWLVDEFYRRTAYGPSAAPTRPTETTATKTHGETRAKGRLGAIWFLVPLGFLSLIVIVPAILFFKGWFEDRRVQRRFRNELGRELPPLPKPREPERTPDRKD